MRAADGGAAVAAYAPTAPAAFSAAFRTATHNPARHVRQIGDDAQRNGACTMVTEISPRVSAKRAPADGRIPLRAVVIVALLIVTAAAVVAQLLTGDIIPPEMGFVVGGPVGAGVLALPGPWAMAIPLLLIGLLIVGPPTLGFPQYAP